MDVCGGWKWVDYGGCTMESTYLCIKKPRAWRGDTLPKWQRCSRFFRESLGGVFGALKSTCPGIIGGFLSFNFFDFCLTPNIEDFMIPRSIFFADLGGKTKSPTKTLRYVLDFLSNGSFEKTKRNVIFNAILPPLWQERPSHPVAVGSFIVTSFEKNGPGAFSKFPKAINPSSIVNADGRERSPFFPTK